MRPLGNAEHSTSRKKLMETYEVQVHANGDKYWYQNGQHHRLDGPAIEYTDGAKYWYIEGQRHRLDGPAVEYPDGIKHWYIEGEFLTEAEFLTRTQPPKPDCSGKTVVIDGITYRLERA